MTLSVETAIESFARSRGQVRVGARRMAASDRRNDKNTLADGGAAHPRATVPSRLSLNSSPLDRRSPGSTFAEDLDDISDATNCFEGGTTATKFSMRSNRPSRLQKPQAKQLKIRRIVLNTKK